MPEDSLPPVETLIEQLHSNDWMERCDAARLLGQSHDPRAVDALLPDLSDKDWRVRRNAAQALGALRDKRAVEPLLLALQDRTVTIRQRAIVALGRIKDPQALPALLDIVLQNRHESLDAAKAVRKFGRKALPDISAAFEKSQDEQLLRMLVDLKYERIFDILIQQLACLKDTDRITAICELGDLGNKKAVPFLVEQLRGSEPTLQSEVVYALGKLGASETIPNLLGLLIDDELYGPRSGVYHAVADVLQIFGGITEDIKNAFPGKYPRMFNMGGAPIGLPEALGLLDHIQSPELLNAFQRLQNGFERLPDTEDPFARLVQDTLENVSWKSGVIMADARDARQDRVKRLMELLRSEAPLKRAAAALTLPWYGDERSLDLLIKLVHDPDAVVHTAATWAVGALQKAISYRNQFGI